MTTISEVMTKGVQVIPPDASLQRAAQLMDELNVGALPVCDGKSLVGMITEATRWCTEDQTTDDVMKQMGDVQIRRLPVLNDRQEVVGIVSLGDLALRQSGHTDELLRDVSWPSEPERPDANAAAHFTG